MTEEVWKAIEGYEDYEISNFGRVKSYKAKDPMILKSYRYHKQGYQYVCLCKKGKSKGHWLHRLVARAFIPNPEGKPYVNHIDDNPANNHVSNLAWCTQSENLKHSFKDGKRIHPLKGKTNKTAFKLRPVVRYDLETGHILALYRSSVEAELYGFTRGCIHRACQTRRTHKGFGWLYADLLIVNRQAA